MVLVKVNEGSPAYQTVERSENSKRARSDCYQIDTLSFENKGKGGEDCLYLNVNTPNLKPTKPLPVMVWIHGGGFFSGSGSDLTYGPEFLIRHDVIYVSINYRLDVLGFLCLDIEEVPGNAGLKDQVLALRWVKRNINNFGGDPENITIFGESAGGVSVSYHLMSPMSKGLFKRAIPQSGASTCNWPNITEPLEKAIKFARKLGFKSTNTREIYKFLQSLPVETIVKLDVPVTFDEQSILPLHLNFGVVSEKKFGDNEVFFSGDVFAVLRQGIHEGVDVMSGFTEHEGVFGEMLGPGTFVCHGDDTMYLFPPKAFNIKIDLKSKEFQMIETVTTLWANFAKYGQDTRGPGDEPVGRPPRKWSGSRWMRKAQDRSEWRALEEAYVQQWTPFG
ncbi:hypothetical protein MSG28_009911 [Choristoneura fumiferana]|uniref:Uncharacterized protein n=1 Tax=Choristoneura fumiferana TaxID=7141 RepID=A0ACC0JD20_CHOFU|nr:hypothetical protein MSG28_009911 [Choristoneura fumiferana]